MAIIANELAEIEKAFRDRPDGVAMGELIGPKGTIAQRRAMARRLQKLIDSGRVEPVGANKARRYILVTGTEASPPPPPARAVHVDKDGEGSVPLSVEGRSLQKQIRRPEIERSPVGYRREFLLDYEPNVTFYLAQDQREHLAKIGAVDPATKPAGTFARLILDRLLIDLSFNSSRLEGNTYSLLDTLNLIQQGKEAEGKTAEEAAMIMNHKGAIEFLVESADEVGFNRHTILNLHALLADGLLDPSVSGRLRQHGVGIGGSVYTPLNNPQVIEECFAGILAKADAILDPFEQSFFVSIHLSYLQPFADVNKRTSRLAANIPFIKRNLTPFSFIDVPDELYTEAMLVVYELNRTELASDMFVWAYERSARRYTGIQQSVGAPDQFRIRYREQLRNVVSEIVRGRLLKTAASQWVRSFAGDTIPADDRKKFAELAETELISLHEGNFARYRVTLKEFYAWKGAWEGA